MWIKHPVIEHYYNLDQISCIRFDDDKNMITLYFSENWDVENHEMIETATNIEFDNDPKKYNTAKDALIPELDGVILLD